ncbi:MAG: hypothetical protein RLZZ546_1446 [Bacteroidota bacterium]|jgi:signal transduction histidine kinase
MQADKDQILSIHSTFWHSFGYRDLDLRFSFCAEDITFIGTGLHERATSKSEYRSINEKGVLQYPHQFEVEILWAEAFLKGDFAWVETEINFVVLIDHKEVKDFIRVTTIFEKIDNEWKICHVHGSSPDYKLTDGDYMTNEVNIIKNIELEKLVFERTNDLKESLDELKKTQKKLIESERLATLGELTAGIAHEIKNPLNFINNFSDLNNELLEELKEKIFDNLAEEDKLLFDDVKANFNKIIEHGKRADSIVKSMLNHSRNNSEIKEIVDINDLIDENLRLTFHGFRAKDKSFNTQLETHFDSSSPKVLCNPQEIGRVIINIVSNAFYALVEKSKSRIQGYKPLLAITSKEEGEHIKIIIKDNGTGMPLEVIEKIFQPFYSTKPAGQGTGLGLSMCFEIVKNQHKGEIFVTSLDGEWTEFIIILPK